MKIERIFKTTALIIMASSTMLIAGCSSWLGIGESEFSCKNIGEGTKCTNTWDIYKMTNGGKSPSEQRKEAQAAKEAAKRGEKVVSETTSQGGNSDFVIDNFVTPNLPNRPIPVRTPAVVMRVWYAPYTDADGNFVVPGYSYMEIEPRRWTLGVNQQGVGASQSKVYEPLKIKSSIKKK